MATDCWLTMAISDDHDWAQDPNNDPHGILEHSYWHWTISCFLLRESIAISMAVLYQCNEISSNNCLHHFDQHILLISDVENTLVHIRNEILRKMHFGNRFHYYVDNVPQSDAHQIKVHDENVNWIEWSRFSIDWFCFSSKTKTIQFEWNPIMLCDAAFQSKVRMHRRCMFLDSIKNCNLN